MSPSARRIRTSSYGCWYQARFPRPACLAFSKPPRQRQRRRKDGNPLPCPRRLRGTTAREASPVTGSGGKPTWRTGRLAARPIAASPGDPLVPFPSLGKVHPRTKKTRRSGGTPLMFHVKHPVPRPSRVSRETHCPPWEDLRVLPFLCPPVSPFHVKHFLPPQATFFLKKPGWELKAFHEVDIIKLWNPRLAYIL